MSALRTILKNVGSNSLGYVVNVVVAFALTPYIVDTLGKEGYGVWSLVVSFVGYYGLLDVGVRSAVGHYVATYHAQNDLARVNRTLSTAMALMLVVAIVAAVVTLFAASYLPQWYLRFNELSRATSGSSADLAAALRDPMTLRRVVLVMGFGFALQFPMALFGTVIYSVQRIDLQNAIGITQVLVRAALTVGVLHAGHGLVGLACVAIGCNALGWAAAIVLAYRVLPGLSLAFRNCARSAARELFSYGGYSVLINVGETVLLYTNSVVVFLATHDAAAVTYYAVPATTLIPYFMQIVTAVTWSFTPYFTGRWATGNVEDVKRLLGAGTRAVLMLAALIGGGLIVLGHDFMAVWQKPDFVSGTLFPTSTEVLAVLAVVTLLRASQSCGRQALFAMREVRYLGLLVLAESFGIVALSVIVALTLARADQILLGVAYATLIPVIFTQGFVQPRHLLRELGVDWRRYLWDSLRACVPTLIVMGAMNRLLGDHLAIKSLATFLLRGVAVAAPALVVGLFCGTDASERSSFLRRLLARPKPT